MGFHEAVHCAREKEREMEELMPISLRARPVRWVSMKPCTAYSVGHICYLNTGLNYPVGQKKLHFFIFAITLSNLIIIS